MNQWRVSVACLHQRMNFWDTATKPTEEESANIWMSVKTERTLTENCHMTLKYNTNTNGVPIFLCETQTWFYWACNALCGVQYVVKKRIQITEDGEKEMTWCRQQSQNISTREEPPFNRLSFNINQQPAPVYAGCLIPQDWWEPHSVSLELFS